MVIPRQKDHHHAVNEDAADHQQRQHTEEGLGLNALTNLPFQFYIPPLSWFLWPVLRTRKFRQQPDRQIPGG